MNRWLTIYYIEIQFPLLNDNWTRKGKGKNFLTCIKQSQCSLNFDIVNCCCNSNWKEITFFLNLIESKKRKTRQTFVLFFHSQEQFLFSALGFTNEKWKPFVNWNCTRALQYTSHGRTHSSITRWEKRCSPVKIFIRLQFLILSWVEIEFTQNIVWFQRWRYEDEQLQGSQKAADRWLEEVEDCAHRRKRPWRAWLSPRVASVHLHLCSPRRCIIYSRG